MMSETMVSLLIFWGGSLVVAMLVLTIWKLVFSSNHDNLSFEVIEDRALVVGVGKQGIIKGLSFVKKKVAHPVKLKYHSAIYQVDNKELAQKVKPGSIVAVRVRRGRNRLGKIKAIILEPMVERPLIH